MNQNPIVTVEVSGEKERVIETLDTLAKVYVESWRKVHKVPHYDTLYRGRGHYAPAGSVREEDQ